MKRFRLLLAGLVALIVMLVCAATPVIWDLQGRQPESYPELVFAFLGLPLGALATLAGGLFAGLPATHARIFVGGVGATATCACAVLLAGVLLPIDDAFATTALEVLVWAAPVGFMSVFIATALALAQSFRSKLGGR